VVVCHQQHFPAAGSLILEKLQHLLLGFIQVQGAGQVVEGVLGSGEA